MKLKHFQVLFINLILIEILAFTAVRVFYISPPPLKDHYRHPAFFIDTDKPFGAWHYKDIKTRHIGPRWNVQYKFNNEGARDKERTPESPNTRLLFLGDSFIEGYGIKQKDRLSDKVESKLGVECLNFAVSGIGQTQMRLIYEDFGEKYDHDAVFISFYPYNDFKDNDFRLRKTLYGNRYRPYSVKDSLGNYQLKYYLSSAEESDYYSDKVLPRSLRNQINAIIRSDSSVKTKIYRLFTEFTYSGSKIKEIVDHTKSFKNELRPMEEDFHLEVKDEVSWDILVYELSLMKEMAGERPVFLMLIPNIYDFEYKDKYNQKSFVQTRLKELSNDLEIHLVDFLKEMNPKNYRKLYINNDDHWNERGNELAMKILLEHINEHGLID